MIKIKLYFLITVHFLALYFFSFTIILDAALRKAVFVVPVVDLFFDQLSTMRSNKSLKDLYLSMPCASSNTACGCWRATQGLFNDVVDVVDQKGEEVCIDTGRLFFDAPDRDDLKHFWAHKESLLFLDDVASNNIDISAFPNQINMSHPQTLKNKNIITLIMPWHDTITKKTYSAGTRFVKVAAHPTSIVIKIFDASTYAVHVTAVPRAYCIIEKNMNNLERQNAYVRLLKKWTKLSRTIPYVWGGASLIALTDDNYEEIEAPCGKKTMTLYERPTLRKPYSGFDCSGLIARAAQIFGIPYFFKNTLTLAKYLRPLSQGETLEEGDLIWFPGHVMVVSTICQHETIEAAGYGSGFGKLQSIKLHKRFLNIYNYDNLLQHYFNKKKLTLLDKQGKFLKTIDSFVIYKFSSVWDYNK